MLDTRLDPLTFNRDGQGLQYALEAFAYTYLSSFNLSAISGRNEQAFDRSYGPDQLDFFQRVNGSFLVNQTVQPAFVVARYTSSMNTRAVIAIEGVSGFWQANDLWNQRGLSAFLDEPGNAFSPFVRAEANVWARLSDSGVLNAYMQHAVTPITVTGHSLGAGIAELLARRLKRAYPANPVTLVTFGSPRVGTLAFRDGGPVFDSVSRVYCASDPIESFPQWLPTRNQQYLFGGGAGPAMGLCVPCTNPDHYTFGGRRTSDAVTQRMFNPVAAILDYPLRANPNTIWYYHDLVAYRYMLTQLAQDLARNERLRFQHLEYPTENGWGAFYTYDGGITTQMTQLNDPAPGDTATDKFDTQAGSGGGGDLPSFLFQNEVAPEGVGPERGQYGPSRIHRQHR